MEYNTTREHLIIPEYGRHIQKMVDVACELENRDERNLAAKSIIKVMGQINPSLRDVNEFNHMLWDHLFIISDFRLDVDSPFPIPSKDSIKAKPEKVPYNNIDIPYKHYGKYIQNFIKKATELESEEEKLALTKLIANMMKKAYVIWNKDSVTDEEVINDLEKLSRGQLTLTRDTELVKSTEFMTKVVRKSRPFKKKKRRS